VFLGILDPDPLVRGMDPDPLRIRILLSFFSQRHGSADTDPDPDPHQNVIGSATL
jgi:hypothetical protein